MTTKNTPVAKTCSVCKESKPLPDFCRDGSRADGLQKRCKVCDNARKRGHQNVNPLHAVQVRKAQEAKAATERAALTAALEENRRLKATIEKVERVGAPPTISPYSKSKFAHQDAIACVLASDWHVEEPVDAESVNGLNEYNLEIAKRRAQFFFRNSLRLTDIQARESKIDTIWLGAIGDFITNYLHEENREMNELPPEEAARFAQDLLASGINFWLKESSYKLIVDCVAGNHGRMTIKRRAANHSGTSLETFMYHSLAQHFAGNPRVEFRVARSKMLYRRMFERFVLRVIHGDDIGYQGGIGGVSIPLLKKIAGWDQAIRADFTVLGHFHERIPARRFLINSSLIGYNAYAQSLGASPEEPVQSFFLVSARGGGQVSVQAPVWLDDAHKVTP